MSNLKELKNRITSVKSTQKITSAMKMVAASRLKRAQEAAESARPYAERMRRMMASVFRDPGASIGGNKLLAGTGSESVHLIVVITSARFILLDESLTTTDFSAAATRATTRA